MTYAVTLALVLQQACAHPPPGRPFAFLGTDLAATAAAGWAIGLFHGTASGGSDALYGYFSMNLNSLWNPAGVGGMDWSLFLPCRTRWAATTTPSPISGSARWPRLQPA